MSVVLSGIMNITFWIYWIIFSSACYIFQIFSKYTIILITEQLFLFLIIIILSIFVYLSWTTADITIDLTAIGYDYIRKKARKRGRRHEDLIQEVNESRDTGDTPPAFPNGWICVAESRDLGVGQSMPVDALGHQFVIFRGKTGKSFILDAYCPHLGAHLGVDGKVHDDCLECPFHGWRFSGNDGSCVKIPYSDKVPEFAKVKTWTSLEQNGFIYVWHHAEGEPPSWYPPVVSQISEGLWYYRGRTEHNVKCHIQEIPENGSDTIHFNQIHKVGIMAKNHMFHPNNRKWKIWSHVWESSWEPDTSPNQHISLLKLVNNVEIFGKAIGFFKVNLDVQQIGPAIVHLQFKTCSGTGIFIQNITPEGPLRQKIVHHFYGPSKLPQILCRIILKAEAIMLERDVTMWNNKKFMRTPLLVAEDRAIGKFRRWYSQFYSKNSPKLINKRTFDW